MDDRISFTATVKKFWKESSRVIELRLNGSRLHGQLFPVDVDCFINTSVQSVSLKRDERSSIDFRSSYQFANSFLNLNLENHSQQPVRLTFYVQVGSFTKDFNHQFFDSLMTDQLWAAARDRLFTDVEFLVAGEVIAAHRAIVTARCPVLGARIDAINLEKDVPLRRVNIPDVTASVFGQLLYFLYTGTLKTPAKDNAQLWTAADQFQVETLVRICRNESREAETSADKSQNLSLRTTAEA